MLYAINGEMTWKDTTEIENEYAKTLAKESREKLGAEAGKEIMEIIGRCLLATRETKPLFGGMSELLVRLKGIRANIEKYTTDLVRLL